MMSSEQRSARSAGRSIETREVGFSCFFVFVSLVAGSRAVEPTPLRSVLSGTVFFSYEGGRRGVPSDWCVVT